MSRIGTLLMAVLFFLTGLTHTQAAELPLLAVVDQAGRPVAEAVVVLEDARAIAPAVDTPTAEVAQTNLQFVPSVIAVQTGTRVQFPNNDNTRHHVYSFSSAKTFELQLFKGNQAPPVLFDQPGLVVVGCNIHDAMRGYIYVVDSPVHGITDTEGFVRLAAFEHQDSPRLTVRHPRLKQPLALSVADLTGRDGSRLEIILPFTLPDSAPEPEASSLRNRLQRYNDNGD